MGPWKKITSCLFVVTGKSTNRPSTNYQLAGLLNLAFLDFGGGVGGGLSTYQVELIITVNSPGHLCHFMTACSHLPLQATASSERLANHSAASCSRAEQVGERREPRRPLQAFLTKQTLFVVGSRRPTWMYYTPQNAATFVFPGGYHSASSVPRIPIASRPTSLCPFPKGSILNENSDIFSHAGSDVRLENEWHH